MTYQQVCNFLDFIKSTSLHMLENSSTRYAGMRVFNVGEACQFPLFTTYSSELHVYRVPSAGTQFFPVYRYMALVRDVEDRTKYCIAWFSFHDWTVYTMDLVAFRNGPGELLGCLRRHHSITTPMTPGFSIFEVEIT